MTAAKSRFKTKYLLAVIGVALLAGYFVYSKAAPVKDGNGVTAKNGDKKARGNRVPTVSTAAARLGDVQLYLNGLGTVTPSNSVIVKSRVDGQLMRLAFREGQFVQAGDVLAEIDSRPFLVQLAQAEGQLAKDQALLANARADLERYRTLLAQDSIAKQQLDTQESLVRQYEAVVKTDQGVIASAKLQLSYARVTAPISGRIGLRQIDAGNIVHASDANGLVVITQLQPITTVFTLPEDQLPQLLKRLQNSKSLTVEAFDRAQTTKLADGTLLTVDNQIDRNTGSVKLKAQFANKDSALFPNQFVNVRLHLDTLKGVTLVPAAAVQRGPKGTFVYVVNQDQTVSLRPVTIGASEGTSVAVEGGIEPGETLVVDGLDKLRDGAKVVVATAGGDGDDRAGGKRRGKSRDVRNGDAGKSSGERASRPQGQHDA